MALGLTTVVIIGVPALMFAVNTLGNITDLERAEAFATGLINETRLVDIGTTNKTELAVLIPEYVTISASESTLTITFTKEGIPETQWKDTFLHPVSLLGSTSAGQYSMTISLVAGTIEIVFASL
ncbi:MAG: hypothetical protein EAX81_01535 [Candidatus Thorarchaeota archaeon]|nr:hypothetical protein [Candidatus Thorarchaeota archaeon]